MKEKLKRLFASLAAVVMAVAMMAGSAIPAMAAQTYSITISNAKKSETYTAYKVFDVTYNTDKTAYSYTITDTSATTEWFDELTSGKTAETNGDYVLSDYGIRLQKTSTSGLYNVVVTDANGSMTTDHAKALAAFLATKTTGKTSAGSVTPDADGSATINVSPDEGGYYFVTTSLGSLCALNTSDPTASITEKNSVPSVEKTVSETSDGTYGTDATVDIGDTVYYKTVVTDGTGTDVAITVHDTLSAGQTLDISSFNITDDDDNTNTPSYTIKYDADAAVTGTAGTNVYADTAAGQTAISDGCTFEIVFSADYIKSLGDGKKITIAYSAKLNENAVVAGDGNTNKTHIEYSHQTSTESTTTVHTYAGAIYKVDGSDTTAATELAGVKFTAKIGNNDAYFTTVQAGSATEPAIYKYNSTNTSSTNGATNEVTTPASGAIVFIGLDSDTSLVLTESYALPGYNKLTDTVTVPVKATTTNTEDKSITTTGGKQTAKFEASTYNGNTLTASKDDGGYQIAADSIVIIENLKGSVLPSTGGMGTTLFYTIGGILVAGAVILLVIRRRKNA